MNVKMVLKLSKLYIKNQYRNISYKKMKTWYSNLVNPAPNQPPYHHIVQIGDPTLRTMSENIPEEYIKSPEIKFLINTMKHVFKEYNCVGLTAPQIGVALRILMFEFNAVHAKAFSEKERQNREMRLHPFTIIINPEMKVTDYAKVNHTELCESVRGFLADVPRYRAVQVKGFNEDANSVQYDLSGWNARIVQHEMDHLNGILYTDIMDRKTLSCTCWEVVNHRGGRVELPYGPP